MVIVTLQQHFPLGRFHANPWKAFPFDDPYGEWPPSPWRLIRAIVARSHQLACEEPGIAENDRAKLVRAFCSSSIRWYLPAESWRGPGLRQYQPAEFSRVPKSATEPGYMAHATTKNQDNCWLIGGDEAVWWFIADPKRLRRVFKVCKDFGQHLQFSVFECDLTASEKLLFEEKLIAEIKREEDQVLVIRLGPAEQRGQREITAVGLPYINVDTSCFVV
jgi:CRISPR-associated endonuclease Cas2